MIVADAPLGQNALVAYLVPDQSMPMMHALWERS